MFEYHSYLPVNLFSGRPSLAARLGLVGVLTPSRRCPTRVDGVGKMYPVMGGQIYYLPLMHSVQSITTERHDGIYFVVVVRLVNAHSSKLKFIIFRQLIANAYPEPIN